MTVHFIGAGPGAPDLITVRGLRLIERCPVCLYAGSLVPREIVAAAPPNARVIDTASLTLDEIIAEIEPAHHRGAEIARVDGPHGQRRELDREHSPEVLECGLSQLGIVDARDHHHGCIGPLGAKLAEQPVTGLIGKLDVEQGQRVVVFLDVIPRLCTRERDVGIEPATAERALHRLREGLLIVDDEGAQRGGRTGHHCAV